MINGRSYYQFRLRCRTINAQDQVGIEAFVALFSTKVLRGGPRSLFQLTTCFVLLLLLLKLLPHTARYSGWRGQNADAQASTAEEDDGSVPGGLRIVVFGDKDVATPAQLRGNDTDGVDNRSWTELLCDELRCSSYLSLVPTSDDHSRVMTSTKLYATSVDQSLNLTFEEYGPGLDYNFMLDEFPVDWKVNDLSRQVEEFLAMKKPRHSPAETIWVLSFGMWDIWSLAPEPLDVSEAIVDSAVDQIFVEIERIYASALNDSSIAWSDPESAQPTTTRAQDWVPTPTPDPDKTRAWIKKRGEEAKGGATIEAGANDLNTTIELDTTKHFRILIPKLFDPSLTPGWQEARPTAPAPHSKAEQMRNAAVLTERWNDKLWSGMADWIRSDQRSKESEAGGVQRESEVGPPIKPSDPEFDIDNEKMEPVWEPTESQEHHDDTAVIEWPQVQNEENAVDAGQQEQSEGTAVDGRQQEQSEGPAIVSARQEQSGGTAVVGGQNHINPPPAPEQSGPGLELDQSEGTHARRDVESGADRGPPLPQRDGILYELNTFLEETISQRQLRNLGFEYVREEGRPVVDDFVDVRMPCIRNSSRTNTSKLNSNTTAVAGTASGDGDTPYQKKRSATPVIRGRAPASPSDVSQPGDGGRVCDEPDDHLFYTAFTVSSRAVAAIAKQAADMVKRNESVRSGWASINLPHLAFVGG